MASTYEPIATTTLGSAQASVSFSSISGSYTDLVIIYNAKSSTGTPDMTFQINGDTATNYSATRLTGTGSAANSGRYTSKTYAQLDEYAYATTSNETLGIVNVMNYSNTTTYKTIISRSNAAANGVEAFVNLWRSTSAITSIVFSFTSGNIASGATFTLYGIKAA